MEHPHYLQNMSTSAADVGNLLVLLDDPNISKHGIEILDVIGGIDSVLRNFVRISQQQKGEELLSSLQIEQISNIITSNAGSANTVSALEVETVRIPAAPTIWDRMYSRAQLKDDVFHLSHSDTLLHSIVSNHVFVDRLHSIVFSKITPICLFIVYVATQLVSGDNPNIYDESTWFFATVASKNVMDVLYLLMLILFCNVLCCSKSPCTI